ncbi:MAG TPA: hypothetical protein VM328_10285 [Fimbriimonadaceae bacterium]|nr:hypothetical protein [Fimbriimonadaceae bacterium]
MPKLLTREQARGQVLDGRFLDDWQMVQFVRERGRVFATPPYSRPRMWLARVLTNIVLTHPSTLYVYDMFESSEDLPDLYERVRRSEGLNGSISEKPGDAVEIEEFEYLECLVACGLWFECGFVLSNKDLMVLVSDDEWFAVASTNRARTDEVATCIRDETPLDEISWRDLSELFGEEDD